MPTVKMAICDFPHCARPSGGCHTGCPGREHERTITPVSSGTEVEVAHDQAKGLVREHMVFQEALAEARKMQVSGQYISGSVFLAMDSEITRLNYALQRIAHYSPASTIQPVAIARLALKGEAW